MASEEYDEVDANDSRNRRRSLITLLVVVLLLGGAFYYAYSYIRPSSPASTSATTSTCPPKSAPAAAPSVDPRTVTVNVYNATKKPGLAGSVAKQVSANAYTLGKVANDPLKKQIAGPGEIRYGPSGEAGAKALAVLLPGAALVQDTRKDASVDLVLGDGFQTFAPTPTATSSVPGC